MEKVRVKNGFGLRTSTLSTTVIGCFDASSDKRKANIRAWDRLYNIDATFQMSQLQDNHPARKILHMQKCYPETVRRLNDKGNGSTTTSAARLINSRMLRYPSPNNRRGSPAPVHLRQCPNLNPADSGKGMFDDAARQRRASEYRFCHDKMDYNRTKGREAEIDGILTGQSPLDKKLPLFPAKATHQELLGLVQRPSNPDVPAPTVPRVRKWLGDNVGWEGNRGLPTPPAGRNAKDGEVHPWPSSQYPHADRGRCEPLL